MRFLTYAFLLLSLAGCGSRQVAMSDDEVAKATQHCKDMGLRAVAYTVWDVPGVIELHCFPPEDGKHE